MKSISELLDGALETLIVWAETFFKLLPNIGIAIVVAVISAWVARRASKWIGSALRSRMSNQAAANMLGRLGGAGITVGGLFIILNLLHLDQAVTSVLAGIGVAGVALGFALQDTASNFVAGLIMSVRRPFAIGDSIEITGYEGVVHAIEMRYTELRTYDGLVVSIPNRDVIRNPLLNITSTTERRVDLDIGIAYGDDLDEAQRILCESVSELEGRDQERDVDVIYTAFGDSSISAKVRFWLTQAETPNYLSVRSNAIKAVKRACDENHITIPFPIRTLDFGAGPAGGMSLEQVRGHLRQPA